MHCVEEEGEAKGVEGRSHRAYFSDGPQRRRSTAPRPNPTMCQEVPTWALCQGALDLPPTRSSTRRTTSGAPMSDVSMITASSAAQRRDGSRRVEVVAPGDLLGKFVEIDAAGLGVFSYPASGPTSISAVRKILTGA